MPQSFFVNPAGTSGTVVGVALAPDGSAAAPSYSFASDPITGMFHPQPQAIEFTTNAAAILGLSSPNAVLANNTLFGWSATTNPMGGNDTWFTRSAPGTIALNGTTPMLQFGGTTNAFPALLQNGTQIQVRLADNSAYGTLVVGGLLLAGPILSGAFNSALISPSAPTIGSGFGTSPSITNTNGTASIVVNVGTGATASSGVINTPVAAHAGWIALCNDIGNTAGLRTVQTASTTTTITLTCQNITTGAATAWAASTLVYVIAMGY
jgi:hypothetical protein